MIPRAGKMTMPRPEALPVLPAHSSTLVPGTYDVHHGGADDYRPSSVTVWADLPELGGTNWRPCPISVEPAFNKKGQEIFKVVVPPDVPNRVPNHVHVQGARIAPPPGEGSADIYFADGPDQTVLREDNSVWIRRSCPAGGSTPWKLQDGAEGQMRRVLAQQLASLENILEGERETAKTRLRPLGAFGTQTLAFQALGNGSFRVDGEEANVVRRVFLEQRGVSIRVSPSSAAPFDVWVESADEGLADLSPLHYLVLQRGADLQAYHRVLGTPGAARPKGQMRLRADQIQSCDDPEMRLALKAALLLGKQRDSVFAPAEEAQDRGESAAPPRWVKAFEKGDRLGYVRLGPTVLFSHALDCLLPAGEHHDGPYELRYRTQPDGRRSVYAKVAEVDVTLLEAPISHVLDVWTHKLPVKLFENGSVQLDEVLLDPSNKVLRGHAARKLWAHYIGGDHTARLADFVRHVLSPVPSEGPQP